MSGAATSSYEQEERLRLEWLALGVLTFALLAGQLLSPSSTTLAVVAALGLAMLALVLAVRAVRFRAVEDRGPEAAATAREQRMMLSAGAMLGLALLLHQAVSGVVGTTSALAAGALGIVLTVRWARTTLLRRSR